MKIHYVACAVLAMGTTAANAEIIDVSKLKYFVGTEAAATSGLMKQGGYNLEGFFANTGTDRDTSVNYGVNAGVEYDKFILTASYRNYNSFDFDEKSSGNNSYKTSEDAQTYMLSATYKLYENGKWDIYAGPGVGVAKIKARTSETLVRGQSRNTNLAWQLEAGTHYALTDNVKLLTGARYVDLGKTESALIAGAATPGGRYNTKLRTAEIFAGIQYSF